MSSEPRSTQSDGLFLSQGVSIVVPVYNESSGLDEFLREFNESMASFPYPWEIMLVDDGSADGTPALLESQQRPWHRHEINRGYGAAIKTGIAKTSYPAIVIIDADGTYAPDDILKVAKELESADMSVGARTGEGASIPWERRPAKWAIRCFAEWMVRRKVPDLNSGLRAFRRERVEPFLKLLPDGFSLTTTLTVAFHANALKVAYLPIQYRKRSGKSKFRPFADTWNMILVILRTIVLIRPLNFFLPLSLALFFAAFAVGLGSHLMGRFMDATFIVLMMTSIQMFVLGLVADLIVRVQLWTH